MKLTEAARRGDRRETLISLRYRLAKAIETTESGRDMAALSKRLMEVMRELESMPDPAAADTPVERARRKRSK